MRIPAILFLVLSMVACNNSPDQSQANRTDHTHLLETDTSLVQAPDSAKLPADDELQHYTPDTTDLSPEPKSAAKIMIEGRFHKHEVWQGAEQKPWMALVQDDSVFRLQPSGMQVTTFFDPVYDKGRQVRSGREVRGEHPNTLLFVTGIAKLQASEVDTVGYPDQVILPNTAIDLRYKGKTYTLAASGDSIQQEGSESYSVRNYRWTVTGTKNGRRITQELASDENFESAIYVLLWVGDLDRDGIPDLLADLSNHFNTSKVTLFLSSLAEKGKLYKKVADFKTEAYPEIVPPDSVAKP
ncbi:MULTISPECIES: hypothetical protein [Pontibacter]|uniref:Lipoprotein n=1 Tax=Pontibacter lucknowensis TaxID=1077936 RepID=A0A1N6WGD8_9BACT|nr:MULTISPECIES: hypothetical protein [Pontibacter]EJF11546.1 hypothetical protein O71_02397 [Pontibacter sp. BAB1700]SIQ89108.1 hypothetical protein SAMN05421545_1522 [Pontibacter lucknowensis]